MRISLNNAEHPDRKLAIKIIEEIIEPFHGHGIDGDDYYSLEDKLTILINNERRNKSRKP